MTDIQETILYIILSLQNQNQAITLEALQQPLTLLAYSVQNLKVEVDRLAAMGFLICTDGYEYLLTQQGKSEASRIYKIRTREEFSGVINRASNSAAYLDFCAEVYGYRMPLFNMMDKEQLDFVFDSIQVSSSDRVLDIGCGNGCILDHLVKKYGCYGVGIDHIDPPETAQNGTISFIKGDIDKLLEYGLTPNICISVDSLYFSADLEALLNDLKSISVNRLYLFYSQYIFDAKKKQEILLHADHTRLGAILRQANLPYKTIDFSTNERSLYENELGILPKYRDSFAAEGNIRLYENKQSEYTIGKSLYDQGLASRYLYIVMLK